ncbi:MAG: ABC transporter substrate-binding protein [Clostridiales bacterium]|nr:ABC transporter substrate-binding protein [Clostridiales bacterium]
MNRFITKTILAVTVAAVSMTAMTACGKKTDTDNYAVVGITQEPGIFDPHTVVAAGDEEIIFNIYEGLYKFDAQGKLNPCLATDVEISSDASVYTFTIREGVKFHDGSELDANDVVYSLKRAAGLLESQAGTALVAELDPIESVTVTSDGRVEVKLEVSNCELLSYFTTGIIPEGYDNCQAAPVGTGPFKFESYNPGQSVILVKNENYWQKGLPYLDKVTFKVCADMDAGLTELSNGSIDIFPYLMKDRADQLDPAKFNVLSNGSNMVQIFALNNSVEPLNDVRVRQAMSYAISRKDIISVTMDGAGVELTTAMSPAMGSYYDTSLDGTYNQDVEKAKALLAEAGYDNGFDITCTVPSSYLVHVNTAVELASELKAIGINMEIKQVDWATWLDEVYAGRHYDTTVICLTSTYAPFDVVGRYESNASGNFINYSNARVDELLNQIPMVADDNERTELYHQVLALLTEDACSVYIQDPTTITAVSTRLEGYSVYPMYVQDMSTVKLVEN